MSKIAGIGACVADTLFRLPHYPPEDTKLRAAESRRAGGGPVATGLVAAAKLGVESGYLGVLSDDADGTFLLEDFKKYGVDTENIVIKQGCRSFVSTIWLSAGTGSRTCVFDKGDLPPLTLTVGQKSAIRDARLLMVDGNELSAAVEGAALANRCGTRVLYDAGGLYDGVEQLLQYTDILIPSEEFALQFTGCSDAEAAAARLWEQYRPDVVVVTRGKAGGFLYNGARSVAYPAYPAEVVDSNGAGDVFHGAFAAGVCRRYDYETCCHFASAVSAIKCTGVGARESVPDFGTVNKYLKENGYEL